jgi:hypothetical protein
LYPDSIPRFCSMFSSQIQFPDFVARFCLRLHRIRRFCHLQGLRLVNLSRRFVVKLTCVREAYTDRKSPPTGRHLASSALIQRRLGYISFGVYALLSILRYTRPRLSVQYSLPPKVRLLKCPLCSRVLGIVCGGQGNKASCKCNKRHANDCVGENTSCTIVSEGALIGLCDDLIGQLFICSAKVYSDVIALINTGDVRVRKMIRQIHTLAPQRGNRGNWRGNRHSYCDPILVRQSSRMRSILLMRGGATSSTGAAGSSRAKQSWSNHPFGAATFQQPANACCKTTLLLPSFAWTPFV